jgi:hypothetical protein
VARAACWSQARRCTAMRQMLHRRSRPAAYLADPPEPGPSLTVSLTGDLCCLTSCSSRPFERERWRVCYGRVSARRTGIRLPALSQTLLTLHDLATTLSPKATRSSLAPPFSQPTTPCVRAKPSALRERTHTTPCRLAWDSQNLSLLKTPSLSARCRWEAQHCTASLAIHPYTNTPIPTHAPRGFSR